MNNSRRSIYGRQVRANLVRTRASEPQAHALHRYCTACASGTLTEAAAGRGLSQRFCHRCRLRLARHGSAFRMSYSAEDMKPFLVAAQKWLKQQQDNSMVKRVEASLSSLLSAAGKPQIATRMVRTSAVAKATNALAKLRLRGVKPSRIICMAIATQAIAESRGERGRLWVHVQTARIVHRKAARFIPPGMEDKKSAQGVKLKWGHEIYGPSSGPFLRVLGKQIVEIAGLLFDSSTPYIIERVRQQQIKANKIQACA
jgi:hypothetical protein